MCVVPVCLDGIPGTRVPGHRRPGTWSQGIFLFYFIFYFGGSSFFLTKNKKNIVFFLFFLSFFLFLSFSVHTLRVRQEGLSFSHIFRTPGKTWRVFFEKDLFEKRKNSSKRLGKHQSDGRSQDMGYPKKLSRLE